MPEPNDHKLPLGGRIYPVILRSFNAQAQLVKARINGEKKNVYYTPDELLRPDDPNLLDEYGAIVPEVTGIWDRSGKRLLGEIGFDPSAWRVTSEYLRQSIQESVLDFCTETQASFRDDLFATYDQLKQAIRQEIDQGRLQNGESTSELTKRIMAYFRDSNRFRARRIAQTEAVRAHHNAREQSAKDTGVVIGWEWVTTSASCPICDAIGNDPENPSGKRIIPIGERFATRGNNPNYRIIKYPPAHPFCRCTVKAVLNPAYNPNQKTVVFSLPVDLGKQPGQPVEETESQLIERLRKDWLEAEKKFISSNGTRYIDDKITMSDRINAYRVGDAKVDAILKLAERYKDHANKASGTLSTEQIREIQTRLKEPFLRNREILLTQGKNAMPYLEKVRDDVFSLLKVEKSDAVEATDRYFQHVKKISPRLVSRESYKTPSKDMASRFNKVKDRIFQSVGHTPKTIGSKVEVACVEADGRKVSTAHNSSFFGVNAFGMSKSNTTVAHELGHAISGNMRNDKLEQVESFNFCKSVYKDKTLMQTIKNEILRNDTKIRQVPDITHLERNQVDTRLGPLYAQRTANYSQTIYRNGATEVPSILLEQFHHDPITFTQTMPKSIVKLVIGFLDGSLR